MTTYLKQLATAHKAAETALKDAAKKDGVKSIADAQFNLEKVEAAMAAARSQ